MLDFVIIAVKEVIYSLVPGFKKKGLMEIRQREKKFMGTLSEWRVEKLMGYFLADDSDLLAGKIENVGMLSAGRRLCKGPVARIYRLVPPTSVSRRTSLVKFRSFGVVSEARVEVRRLTCWLFI